jgi:hypothetical protein
MAVAEKSRDLKILKKRNLSGNSLQTKKAVKLHIDAKVPLQQCGLPEVARFQKFLETKYQIYVISKEHFNGIIYSGPKERAKKLFLYYHDNHFDVITKMPGFMERSFFCFKCLKGHNNKNHSCVAECNLCFSDCKGTKDGHFVLQKCKECNRHFKGNECFAAHKKNFSGTKKSICQKYKKCNLCKKTYLDIRKQFQKSHVCNEMFCTNCNDFVEQNHKCYIKTVSEKRTNSVYGSKKRSFVQKYIFFDFECMQDTGKHIPNLCIAYRVCENCIQDKIVDDASIKCSTCGKKQHIFSGSLTKKNFCLWLFSEENNNAICFAHNFKGYDSYFILQYLYENTILPRVVYNGSKIMYLFVPFVSMKFVDSFNFLPMALGNLPAAFGFENLSKGYWPHFFNTPDNQNVILDKLPDREFYGPDSMSLDGRKAFLEWYQEHENDFFNFQEEIKKYCLSDVLILTTACLKFRNLFMQATSNQSLIEGIDPFLNNVTIASACNLVYRTNFLQPKTIALIPCGGYNRSARQSFFTKQWLQWLSHNQNIVIEHEKRIGKVIVDGYCEIEGV